MRVLCRLVDRWQHRTRDLTLATAGRSSTIGELLLSIMLLFDIVLYLLLQQAQVQLTERISTQAASIESRIVAYQGHALQLLGDAIEADGIDTFAAQGLEQKERLEVCVGGDGHESAVSHVKRRLRWFGRGDMHVDSAKLIVVVGRCARCSQLNLHTFPESISSSLCEMDEFLMDRSCEAVLGVLCNDDDDDSRLDPDRLRQILKRQARRL